MCTALTGESPGLCSTLHMLPSAQGKSTCSMSTCCAHPLSLQPVLVLPGIPPLFPPLPCPIGVNHGG